MVSQRRPGLTVPRKRVRVDSVMWLRQEDSIAIREPRVDPNMCKVMGTSDYEAPAISLSSIDGASKLVIITNMAGLGFTSGGGPCVSGLAIKVKPDNNYEPSVSSPSELEKAIRKGASERPINGQTEEHGIYDGNVLQSDPQQQALPPVAEVRDDDNHIDMDFAQFEELLVEKDPVLPHHIRSEVLHSVSDQEFPSVPSFNQDHRRPTVDDEIALVSPFEQEEDLQAQVQHIGGGGLGFPTSFSHEDSKPEFNLNMDFFVSPTLEGGVFEAVFTSSSPSSTLGSIVEQQSSEDMHYDGIPSVDRLLSNRAFVDHDSPSQNDGSVLASEGKFAGGVTALEDCRMVFLTNQGTSVHGKIAPMSNVVDLTEDSDDDICELSICQGSGGLSGKRRTPVRLESDKRKRLNSAAMGYTYFRRDPIEHPTCRPRVSLQMQGGIASCHLYARREPSMEVGTSCYMNVRRSVQFAAGGLATPLHAIHGGQPNEAPIGRILDGKKLMKGALVGYNREEATLDDGLLSVPLLKHQRLALAWMENRERGGILPDGGYLPRGGILGDDQGLGKTISTISLILKARAPIHDNSAEQFNSSRTVDLGDDDELQLRTNTHENCVVNGKHGDTFGMDSTLDRTSEDVQPSSNKRRPTAGNLVVCPTSVLRQWAHELKEKVTKEASLSVLIYHGSGRTKDPAELAKYDVVLTTYSIVSMEVPKQPLPDEKDGDKKNSEEADFPTQFRGAPKTKKVKKAPENEKKGGGRGKGRLVEGENGSVDSGPLARVNWFRVILDEAQSIKNSRTQVARAAWGLRAKRRWCLSGTPIQNAIEDLYSYFRFLRYAPYDAYKVFREKIKDPVTRTPSEGYENLQNLLRPVMLRRTKATLIDGEPIVDLPPRIVTLKQAEFSDEERAFYATLERESLKQFQDYAAAGTLQSNYVNILWMLLRLRQACDHPLLVKGHKSQGPHKLVLDSARKLPAEQRRDLISVLEANRAICPICNDLPEEAVVCICTHIFCRQCISEQLATGDDTCCPIPKCRKSLNSSLVYTLASLKNCKLDEGSGSGGSLLDGIQQESSSQEDSGWKSSSKIDAVIDTLLSLPIVYMVVENGRVVVQASKDLEDVKLVDVSCVRVMEKQLLPTIEYGPDSVMSLKLIPLVKVEPGPVVKCHQTCFGRDELVSTLQRQSEVAEIARSTNPIKVEEVELPFRDMATKTYTASRHASSAVNLLKPAQTSTDSSVDREPLMRQIVESTEKAIVFSQWTSMLDLLEVKLKQAKFNYRRLDGTMSVLARDRAVSEFKTLPEVTVIIMSLKAASLGLNMVAACHVLLLDVWWNPTTEDQAIDRAHRIGQTRTVNVSRFTVKNTIEDRILALQEKKRRMVASAFGEDEGGGQKSGLTMEDLEYLFGGVE